MRDVSTIAGACLELEQARRDGRERAYPELVYRAVRRAIDAACERIERINLAGGGRCPAEVARLIEQLGLLAGEQQPAPASSHEALDRLFHLASVLLGLPQDRPRSAPRGGRAA
jgi:hypothetical protein